MPTVSIGLPVYNGEEFLEETLDSILAQTYTDFELIISDNASTDRTQAICLAYAARDRRIRYYRNRTNLGAAPNYNRTFDLSSSRYFKWAAADDLIAPTYLAKCVDVLDQRTNVVLCFTRSTMIDEKSEFLKEEYYRADISSPQPRVRFHNISLSLSNIPLTPLVVFGLMRTDVAKQTGLIGSYPSSDVVLIAELALYGQFHEIAESLFLWRHHPRQSVQGELASERNRSLWFDSNLEGKIILPKWLYLAGYLRAIGNSSVDGFSKCCCYFQMVRWILILGNFKSLVKDVLLAAKSAVVCGFFRRNIGYAKLRG